MAIDRRAKRGAWALALWLVMIFLTSSTLVTFSGFVRFVQDLSSSVAFKQWFAAFWLAGSIFVVKGWHFTEYLVVELLAVRVIRSRFGWSSGAAIRAALIFAALFAASDEWHQTFVPDRDGCVRDVVIDCAGALVAAAWLWARSRRRDPSAPGGT